MKHGPTQLIRGQPEVGQDATLQYEVCSFGPTPHVDIPARQSTACT